MSFSLCARSFCGETMAARELELRSALIVLDRLTAWRGAVFFAEGTAPCHRPNLSF